MRQYESYKCQTCGNVVEVQNVGGGTLNCCNKEMECITKDLTSVNLIKAFSGESMARNKYDLFGDIAKESGFHAIARRFYEAAENEKYHARAEYKAYNELNGVNLDDNGRNLLDAIAGEHYENSTMYPDFATIAKEENQAKIARLFEAIGKVEIEHERAYKEIKEMLDDEGFFESSDEEIWVCEICGHIHRGKKAPKACPLCKAPQEYFKKEALV